MKMLETLLSEPKYHVQKSHFMDAVWGDRENPEDAAVRASISRLNKFFSSKTVPIKVDSKNGYIMLIVDE